MFPIKIRRAQFKDRKNVARLWHEYEIYENGLDERITVGSEGSYEKYFEEILGNKSSIVVIAQHNSSTIGIIDYISYRKGKLKIGSLGNIFVQAEYRGKGIGSKLAQYALDQLKNQECKYIISGVRVKNERAQKFWENRGFKVDLESVVNYSMRKDLIEK